MAVMVHTDEQIQQEVLRQLKFDARVQPNEIGVAVKDGVVTLSGYVDSYPQAVGGRGSGPSRAAA